MIDRSMDPGGWEGRWRSVLADVSPDVERLLDQGRGWRRSGRVTSVRSRPGLVLGRVQGSRATPNLVEISIPVLNDAEWEIVLDTIAGVPRHGARLLAGEEPDALETDLAQAGVTLLPDYAALEIVCPCQQRQPCEHAAAVWAAAARQIEHDPFVLLRLRGRGRERLLSSLAARRRSSAGAQDGLAITDLTTRGWRSAAERVDDLEISRQPPPASSAAALRLRGEPPGWAGGIGIWDLLRPLVERGAHRAQALEDATEAS